MVNEYVVVAELPVSVPEIVPIDESPAKVNPPGKTRLILLIWLDLNGLNPQEKVRLIRLIWQDLKKLRKLKHKEID